MEKASRNGVLNSNQADYAAVFLQCLKHFFEGIAANQFDLLVLEIFVGCYVVV